MKRCVHKETKVEYAAKIINTRKLSSRGAFGAIKPFVYMHSNTIHTSPYKLDNNDGYTENLCHFV